MKKSTKILLGLVALLSAGLCVVCCLFIAQYFRGAALNETLEELGNQPGGEKQVVLIPVALDALRQPEQTQEPVPQEQPEWYIHVDFQALQEINPDIYAWIDIPGTGISYAVLQSPTDDLYYNTRSVDKTYYSGGSIYSQRYNAKTFEDPVTVLYGHNRTSKTMFAPVNDYADPDFFDAHPRIYIYMPDRVCQYEIFAAYPHSSEHLLLCHDFSDPEQFSAFFGGLKEGLDTNYRTGLFPDAGERVLTLSTCYKNNRMQRYLVQGVLRAEYLIEVQ